LRLALRHDPVLIKDVCPKVVPVPEVVAPLAVVHLLHAEHGLFGRANEGSTHNEPGTRAVGKLAVFFYAPAAALLAPNLRAIPPTLDAA